LSGHTRTFPSALTCGRRRPSYGCCWGKRRRNASTSPGYLCVRSVAQGLHRLYLEKGALATTAIEGNTLTENEVLQHLEGTLKLPPSKEYPGQEIDNIVGACRYPWPDPRVLPMS
jgi:hypothetical protein